MPADPKKAPKRNPQKEAVCLEILENSLKICAASWFKDQDKPQVQWSRVDWVSKDPAEMSKTITESLKTLGIAKKNVWLNISKHSVISRFFRLPATSDEEIDRMVQMESIRHIPHAIEEMITDYKVIEKEKDGYSTVLVVMVQSGLVQQLIAICQDAGLLVDKIALSSEALYHWAMSSGHLSIVPNEVLPVTAVINIDSEYAELDIIENGRLVFTRAFSYGAQNLLTHEKMVEEISRTLVIFQKEKKKSVEKILISGAETKTREIAAGLTEKEDVPVEIVSQQASLDLHKNSESFSAETSFVDLVGILLKRTEIKINLLPESIRQDSHFRLLKKKSIKTFVLLSAIAVLSVLSLIKNAMDESRLAARLDEQIKTMEPDVRRVRKLQADLKILKEEIQKKPLAIDILSEVYQVMPRGILLNTLDYESEQFLTLKGSGDSLSGTLSFISALENSKYFENVKIKRTTERTRSGQPVTDFDILCALSKGLS